jgi:amphi-Trp domain-containing protein
MARSEVPGWGWLASASVVNVVAGIAALVWPDATVFILSLILGFNVLTFGVCLLVVAFTASRSAEPAAACRSDATSPQSTAREPAMSDVKVEHKVVMTRAEVAQWVADVGKALSGEGTVSISLAESTVELKVPDQVRFEAELEVDGDEVELEIELKWSTARTATKATGKNGAVNA